MYLFERVFALGVYVTILFAICYLIAKNKSHKRCSKLVTLYIVLLAIMGYSFVPHEGADLTRMLLRMHLYASETWDQSFTRMIKTATPGAVLYLRLVGLLHNDSLLPALSAVITFSFCFGIIKRTLKQEDIDVSCIAVILFVFMSRGLLLQIISNIRTLMALSIIAWCIYQEFYRKVTIISLVPFYLTAASLHAMGQALLVFRLFYILVESRKSILQKVLSIALFVFFSILILRLGGKYLILLYQHSENYASYYHAGIGYFYIWEGVLCVCSNMIVLYLYYLFSKVYKRGSDLKDSFSLATYKYSKFIGLLVLVDFAAALVEFNFFQRLSWFITILSIPFGIYVLRELKKNGYGSITIKNLYMLSGVMLFIACARGDLCSLKFFIL